MPPPVPHAWKEVPGWQIPASQQPFAQLWALQQGPAQKLPAVGQSEPAGAAATQTAPRAKPWQSASVVQLFAGLCAPEQMGSPVRETMQTQGVGIPPPQRTFDPSAMHIDWPWQGQVGAQKLHCPS